MSKKIMLVDDAAFMRMTIKNYLNKAGYDDVIEAGDGQIALDMYKEHKPDLVFMDITMPNMDGIQALKAIKEFDGNARVVMCSAMGQESMVIEAITLGAKDFIVKPFKQERVVQAVEQFVG